MKQELRILLVEDQLTDAELEIRELRRAGLRVVHQLVETEAAFRESLQEFRPELIISDFSMPHFDGMWALTISREVAPEVPFIFVSGTIGEEYAIRALKNGATDYVLKSNLVRLPAAVERALQDSQERAARRKAERELEETRSRLDSIVSSLSDVVWSVSIKPYRMLYVSRAIEAVWRRPVQAFYDNPDTWLQQVHPHREQIERSWKGALRGGVFDAVYRIVHDDGAVHWIHDRAKSILDDTGNAVRLDGIARDVTELKQQEQRIARLSRIHAVLSGINSAIVRIRDRQQLFNEACRIAVEHGGFGIAWVGTLNQETLEITPVASAGLETDSFLATSQNTASPRTALGRGMVGSAVRDKRVVFSNDLSSEDLSSGGERRKEAMRRGYRSVIVLPLLVEGTAVGNMSLFAREANFFDDEEITLLTELAGDISFALEHIDKEEKLNYLAYYNQLTGLPNRTLFIDRLEQRIGAARDGEQIFSLIMLDIERFRLINDTLGRPVGDELLRQFAQRLKSAVQNVDLLANLGGDHFVIATRRAGETGDVVHILEQILIGVCGQPFDANGGELRVAAKAGVSVFPADGTDVDSLLRNAEAALKKAKAQGERYLFYAPQMNARVAEQLKLENDLRNAVSQEQYVLHYQPKFDLASGKLSGMEALIRWNHPERGMVPPGQFVPVLEETGMIIEVGRWALKRAALEHAAWCAQGYNPPRIAVNVSQVQLRRKDFVDYVKDALAGTSGAGERIDIEITESMLMEDIVGSIDKLKALQGMGLQIALDDFGTGYSSLSYLARLPINSLKIDRSFIIQMPTSPEQMAIVSAVISLARALNLRVVAEGVETEEQASLLRLLRCDEVQGYLFGRPVSSEAMEKLLPKG